MDDQEFKELAKPLTEPLTVYRALADGLNEEEFTNDDYTSFTTEKAILDGLGTVVSLVLPAGTVAAVLEEDGEVVLDKGLTFRHDGSKLEMVKPEELESAKAEKDFMQRLSDEGVAIGSMDDDDISPPLPNDIDEYLDQIEHNGPLPDWENDPETGEDGETSDRMFGMSFEETEEPSAIQEVASRAEEEMRAREPAAPAAAPAPDYTEVFTKLSESITAALRDSRQDFTPLLQALSAQKAPEVKVEMPALDLAPLAQALANVKAPTVTVSPPAPLDLTPLLKGMAIDYKALAAAFRSLPAPSVNVPPAPAPVDLAPLAAALHEGLKAQADAIRNMPVPQITVEAAKPPEPKPPLRNVTFETDAAGNVRSATLN